METNVRFRPIADISETALGPLGRSYGLDLIDTSSEQALLLPKGALGMAAEGSFPKLVPMTIAVAERATDTDKPADMLMLGGASWTSGDPVGPTAAPKDRDFIRVGRSRIEGTGVFAKRRIHRGARIIEYTGERVPADRLLAPAGGTEPSRVYTFRLNETIVIDGGRGGNASRFINHSCEPNCEAYAFDDRMYIYAMRDIARGEELTFDYKLAPQPGRRAEAGPDEHACSCGAENCRGTMRRTRRNLKRPPTR